MRIRTPKSTDVSTPSPRAETRRPTTPLRWPGQELLDEPVTAEIMLRVWSGDPVTVVPSPPGSGKTRLVVLLAAALAHQAGLRVIIAAQTRAQAEQIGERLEAVTDKSRLIVAAKGRTNYRGKKLRGRHVAWAGAGGGILVATTARWLFSNESALKADVLLVDEAWQCTYADLGAIGALADQVVCVGDPGQIEPVVTGNARRWEDNPTGPQVAAPDALIAAHGDAVGVVRLRHSWRLGAETSALISDVYYRDLPFTSKRPAEHLERGGTVVPEVVRQTVTTRSGVCDSVLAETAARRVRALMACERVTAEGRAAITGKDVAVVVPHVAQAAQVSALLSSWAPDVLVGTANTLQGIERVAVVAYHPLVGRRDAAQFALEPGRACVALSRHRAHVSVICDDAAPDLRCVERKGAVQLASITERLAHVPEVADE